MFDAKTEKAKKKLAVTQKEEKAKRKTRIIAISVTSVITLLFLVSFTINSSFIRRALPVYTIDGVGFTTTEFEYFFNNEYMEYMNFMSQFEGMGGSMPVAGVPLSSQIYNEETGETWADVFTDSTLERLKGYVVLYNAAKEAGFTLSDEQKEEIENSIASTGVEAMMYGFPSLDSFLQQLFGNSINEKEYRKIQEFIATANNYSIHVRDSFEYPMQQLEEYYAEHSDELDIFNYRVLTIYANLPWSEDFEDDEEYAGAVDSALAEAIGEAAAIADGIASEDDFIEAARDYNIEIYGAPDSTLRMTQGERLDSNLDLWMLDEARKSGDVTVIETDQGANIIYFVSREDNSYQTVGMRQILILRDYVDPTEYEDGEFDPEYLEALQQAEIDARARADTVLALFVAAGETEAALLELMEEYSDDTTEGGYYSQISRFSYQGSIFSSMKVVPEIEDWLYDENRVVGDSELVYTADFGYHLLYFTGFYERFFELIADDRLRAADHTEWLESLTAGEPVRHGAFIIVQL